jgi:hypothetical protein
MEWWRCDRYSTRAGRAVKGRHGDPFALRETLIVRRFPAAQGRAVGIDYRRWLIPKQAANPFASAKIYKTMQRRAR